MPENEELTNAVRDALRQRPDRFAPGQIVRLAQDAPPFQAGQHALLRRTRFGRGNIVSGAPDVRPTEAWVDEDALAPPDLSEGIPLAVAYALALDATALLRPACAHVAVAGSVRRGKALCGDIEIVCVPLAKTTTTEDLFGGAPAVSAQSALDALADQLVAAGKLARRDPPAWGARYKRARLQVRGVSVPLDIFAVLPPAQWGVIFAIRTGPAEFSRLLVTPRAQGGALRAGWQVRDGQLLARAGRAIPCPEEEHFFAALGLPFIFPENRDAETLRAAVNWSAALAGA